MTAEQVIALLTLLADLQQAVSHLQRENAQLREQLAAVET